jgi:hypothetical protein
MYDKTNRGVLVRQRAVTSSHPAGLSACAVALHVDDARAAFDAAVAGGAEPFTPPRAAPCGAVNGVGGAVNGDGGVVNGDGGAVNGEVVLSEVRLYGDVALRFVSGAPLERGEISFLPGYVPTTGAGETLGCSPLAPNPLTPHTHRVAPPPPAPHRIFPWAHTHTL